MSLWALMVNCFRLSIFSAFHFINSATMLYFLVINAFVGVACEDGTLVVWLLPTLIEAFLLATPPWLKPGQMQELASCLHTHVWHGASVQLMSAEGIMGSRESVVSHKFFSVAEVYILIFFFVCIQWNWNIPILCFWNLHCTVYFAIW